MTTQAPAQRPHPVDSRELPRSVVTPQSKSIILFSDGTGNSSAKLFKTNVWRMYEAVDLGPAAEGKRPQISYYDDGVGTSSFKPLAAIGGAFGWGLKRNVLDIYRYACRNYREGDEIFAFGFSRGAFTTRVVVALIAAEGLVRAETEADLRRKSAAAYREFRKAFLPRRIQWPTRLARRLHRRIVDWLDGLRGRTKYDSADNFRPHIRFVGVWDTVSAYGGPITEVTRAIDNWFFPLSMPDYHLNERVLCARHALAIDDERDAFHPLLWDEVHEHKLIQSGRVDENRLEQVWFTGMHADVGGGYPDESLSYVSLLWMMEEAERAGLRTLTVIKDRFVALASSFGPIHNSRAGLSAYYRYQPRKIAAWLDPVDARTLSLRDPAITDDRGRSRGLLRSVRVHESVINRIATGTDHYAPITLPKRFDIVPPQVHGENIPQADSQSADSARVDGTPRIMIPAAIRARLADHSGADTREAAFEPIWNSVWWRRIIYFVTLAATLLLLSLPLTGVRWLPRPPILTDGRTWIGGVIRLLTVVLPSFAGRWVEVYADNPFYFLVLAGVIVVLLAFGTRIERRLRDNALRVWALAMAGSVTAPRPTWLERFRNNRRYQRFAQRFKWYFLPDWVVTPITIVLFFWIAFAAYTQAALPFLENGTVLCRPSLTAVPEISRVAHDFRTRDLCSESFGLVHEGHRYVVTFDVVDPWYDGGLAATPEGIPAGEFPVGLGYIAGPFKRVIDAHYLQPLIEIRAVNTGGPAVSGNIQIYPLSVRQVGETGTLFRGDFTAARDGDLFLFVNDAMIPWTSAQRGPYNYRYFYEASGGGPLNERGNRGTACVTVESADAPKGPMVQAPAGSICEQAALRSGQMSVR